VEGLLCGMMNYGIGVLWHLQYDGEREREGILREGGVKMQ